MTETRKKLLEKLKEIYDDEDFLAGVISSARHDDDAKAVMEYIEGCEEADIENIILFALGLYLDREERK